MTKKVILYSMKGCPHCVEMKNILNGANIKFSDRDIDKYQDEYDLFVEATGNEYIPAFMLLTFDEKKNASNVELLTPDRDFDDLPQALDMVKRYLN